MENEREGQTRDGTEQEIATQVFQLADAEHLGTPLQEFHGVWRPHGWLLSLPALFTLAMTLVLCSWITTGGLSTFLHAPLYGLLAVTGALWFAYWTFHARLKRYDQRHGERVYVCIHGLLGVRNGHRIYGYPWKEVVTIRHARKGGSGYFLQTRNGKSRRLLSDELALAISEELDRYRAERPEHSRTLPPFQQPLLEPEHKRAERLKQSEMVDMVSDKIKTISLDGYPIRVEIDHYVDPHGGNSISSVRLAAPVTISGRTVQQCSVSVGGAEGEGRGSALEEQAIKKFKLTLRGSL